MTHFLLIRHGQADYELAERRRLKGMGRDLVPLTAQGLQEVEALAATSGADVELLLSSPMTRALQSAAILAARWHVPLQVEFDLHEWIPDLSCTYDCAESARIAHREFVECNGEWPDGNVRSWEPRSRVAKRVAEVLARYLWSGYGKVGVVCHGAVIEALAGTSVPTGQAIEYCLEVAARGDLVDYP